MNSVDLVAAYTELGSAAAVAELSGIPERRVRRVLKETGLNLKPPSKQYVTCPKCGVTRRVQGDIARLECRTCVDRPAAVTRAKTADDLEWTLDALCARQDPEAWFPESRGSCTDFVYPVEQCFACPVKAQCLRYALDDERGASERYRYGVYGGLLPAERAAMDPSVTQPEKDAA